MSPESLPECFVIAPLGSPGSDVRETSDQVLRRVISPAVRAVGHEPLRADRIHESGLISKQVLSHLLQAPLAVADLTGLNSNVMYELAVRHCSGKAVVLLALSGTKLPFDIFDLRTVFFDLQSLDEVADAITELTNHLNSALTTPNQLFAHPILTEVTPTLLSDEQTRSIVGLHQASSAFRIYRVIDDTVTELEQGAKPFSREAFFTRIRNALMESRRLCACFESRKLGNLSERFDKFYSPADLKVAVEGGLEILLNPQLDSNSKRRQLLEYVYEKQLERDQDIERALRTPPDRT